jgi:hypothetical protein
MARLSLAVDYSPNRELIATEHPSAHPRRRVEVVSTGVDEDLQGIGSDPFGSLSWIGLRVPAFVTSGPHNRYLFLLCSLDVADGDRMRLVGLRHGYSLGIRQQGPRTNELWVRNPVFKPPRANISWHLRVRPLRQLNNPGNGPIQPPLQNFAFRDAQSPALLYRTAAVFAGGFYTTLTAYTSPNRGMPYGRGVTPEFGTFYDLKTDWQDASDWRAIDIPIVGPARVQFFASVQQTPLQKVPVTQGAPFFPLGESAEEQYLANFPTAQIWRVAGALAAEYEDGAELRSMIDHPSQWTDRKVLAAVLQELRVMNATLKGGSK